VPQSSAYNSSSSLKIKKTCSSETPVTFYHTTWRHSLEEAKSSTVELSHVLNVHQSFEITFKRVSLHARP
jgi:hypothetical protein